MRKMKNSGIEWIGKIPNEWNLSKVKFNYSINKAKLPSFLVEEYKEGFYPYMSMEYIREPFDNLPMYSKDGTFCSENDLLLLWDGANAGEMILKHPQGFAPSTCAVLSLTSSCDSVFPKYQMKLIEYELRKNTVGMGIPHVNGNYFKNLPFLYPPFIQQQKIANFLEKKCSEIDDLYKGIESQIDTLEQYKKSVITEAVTKGLDPDAEMKDSGIEFIGKIPNEWKVLRFKNIGLYRNGLTYSPSDLCDENEGILVLRSSNIQNGKLAFEDNVYVSSNIPQILYVQEDDILLCSRNGSQKLVGKSAIIPANVKASFGAFMMIFRCNKIGLPKYVYYLLNSNVFSYYLASFFTSTINQLTGQNFGNMKIPFCYNINKQREIANYLDAKCSEIDAIIADKKTQLETLTEYKKSLIYEYVTGKKEVPHE